MAGEAELSPLAQEALAGKSRRLQLLAAGGLLPVEVDELITLQVLLCSSEDEEIADKAAASLAEVEPQVASQVISESGTPLVAAYFASRSSHPLVLEAVLQRRDLDSRRLRDLAETVPEDLQEILLLRQDAIVEDPSILEALERNPELSSYARRRIAEYREHLLPREAPAVVEPHLGAVELADDEEVAEAISEARELPKDGELDSSTGLSEAQIRSLPLPVRLRLSRGAPRSLRNILLKDSKPSVALSALMYNPISDSEIEQIAASRLVVEEVLEAVARNRQWIRRYEIARALIFNPKTPIGLAVRLIPRLAVRDLRMLAKDRNVADAVRSTGDRLYKIKTK